MVLEKHLLISKFLFLQKISKFFGKKSYSTLVGTLRVRGMGLYIAPSRLIITSYQLNGNGYVDEIDMRVSTK